MGFCENILLFYNNEFEGVKPRVVNLVRQNQAKVTIIDVFDGFDQYLELLPADGSIEELKQVATDERRHQILSHFDDDQDLKEQMEILFKFGNPAVEIIKQTIRGKHDLVIKAASGERSFKKRLFGDIAVKLLRKCPCPVLILKPSDAVSFDRILAPVNPEDKQEPPNTPANIEPSVSKKIMDIAVSISQMTNSHLDVLHYWFLPGVSLLSSGRTKINPDKLKQMITLAEKIHTQRITKLIEKYDLSNIDHSINILEGDPGYMISSFAEDNGIDLIVMGTIGRSGLLGLLIGSTAENVIESVNCSVLTLKPENYKSPIRL